MPIIAGRASAAYGAGFGAVTTIPYQGPFGAYDALTSITVGSGGVASVTFDGIPSDYKHLQIRVSAIATGESRIRMRFNGDTGTNYSVHYLLGNGTNPFAGSGANANQLSGSYAKGTASYSCVNIIDILDYKNTNKNKSIQVLTGYANNVATDGELGVWSGVWRNTSAVYSAILYFDNSANIAQHSRFSLYGVR
jgi:hypothetical protein